MQTNVGDWYSSKYIMPRQIVSVSDRFVIWRYRATHTWSMGGWATVTNTIEEWNDFLERHKPKVSFKEP